MTPTGKSARVQGRRKTVRGQRPRQPPNRLLFHVAFARPRACYFYGCICLTPEERTVERRVFAIARAWGRLLRASR